MHEELASALSISVKKLETRISLFTLDGRPVGTSSTEEMF